MYFSVWRDRGPLFPGGANPYPCNGPCGAAGRWPGDCRARRSDASPDGPWSERFFAGDRMESHARDAAFFAPTEPSR